MATLQNALQADNYFPQVINNTPQVINALPEEYNNVSRISNSASPNFDVRNLTIELTQVNMLYAQMEKEIQEADPGAGTAQ